MDKSTEKRSNTHNLSDLSDEELGKLFEEMKANPGKYRVIEDIERHQGDQVNLMDTIQSGAAADFIERSFKAYSEASRPVSRKSYIAYGVGGLAILGSMGLAALGKFEPSIAALLGSVVGYIFGKEGRD